MQFKLQGKLRETESNDLNWYLARTTALFLQSAAGSLMSNQGPCFTFLSVLRKLSWSNPQPFLLCVDDVLFSVPRLPFTHMGTYVAVFDQPGR